MPRPGKPWWWKAKGRWAANVDGKRVAAPKEIGKVDRIAAEIWYAELRSLSLPRVGISAGQLLVAYFAWRFPEACPDRNSKKSMIKTVCATTIGGKPIGDTRAEDIQEEHVEAAIRAWTKQGKSLGYQRSLVSQWKAAWRWANRRIVERDPVRLLRDNPLAGVKNPPRPMVEDRYAERSEAARWLRWLWRNKDRDYALLQRCLIKTGARPAEWTGGRWSEIQWDAGSMPILVRRAWKSGRTLGKPRRVYVPSSLARSLRRRMRGGNELIFSTPRDRVKWSATNLSTTTQRYRREAIADGVQLLDTGADRLTCYRWRHTAASSLLMQGIDIATVAELLGTSVRMIQLHYGHLLSGHLARAAQVLARGRA